jgi:MerR family transcriptional regulator, copper efflux regulator
LRVKVHVRVLTIGALAREAGVSTPTIRYYEEIGLLPPAGRGTNGQRIYDDAGLQRLTFIKRCRDFGFSIDQVRVLAGLSISTGADCRGVRDIAQSHLDQVREKQAELRALASHLQRFVAACDAACIGGPGCDCIIFQEIAKPERSSNCC